MAGRCASTSAAGSLITIGNLGDRIGRRKMLLIGGAAFGAALTLNAQEALTTALHATSAIGLVISMASAIAAALYLRDREAAEPVEAACPAGA